MKIQPLSTLYKQCKLPNVTKGILGDPLDSGNVSDIFISGTNLLITDYNKNFKRTKPLEAFITKEKVQEYLKQFTDVDYIKKIKEAFPFIKF